jgi:enamine deaminase RidA (YjgF/YER057c/UK114 family)
MPGSINKFRPKPVKLRASERAAHRLRAKVQTAIVADKTQTREGPVAAAIRFINPDTLSKPPTYTQVVEVTGPGRIIYVSGQLANGRDGNLIKGDFRAQAVQVYENLKNALAAVGATFKDVVKINSYLADIADLPVLRDVRAKYLNAKALPASTTLGDITFARPGALLEVEVVAMLPAKAAKAQPASRGARKSKKAKSRGRAR